jgi:AcrR family transcriptional regulator
MRQGYRLGHRQGPLLPRRRDAVRNREKILRTAVEVFSVDGPGVPLTQIARRAGFGPATLYRYFPDRFCLAAAVVEHRLDALDRMLAERAAEFDTDPDAFRSAMHAVVANQVAVRPLLLVLRQAALRRPTGDGRDVDPYTRRLVTRLAEPLRRAQAAGYLRADLAPDDLLVVLTMIEAVLDTHGGGTRAERAVGIVLDGLFRHDRLASMSRS